MESLISQATKRSARLWIVCAFVMVGILVAGLWPFHSPKNNAKWIGDGGGLSLGKYGIVLSAQAFQTRESKGNASCSFEIWLEPARVDKATTIVSFFRPNKPKGQMLLRQFYGDLIFARGDPNDRRREPLIGIYAAKVFRKREPVFLTITTGEDGTAIYTDGVLVQRSSGFRFSRDDLAGQLMFGNAPAVVDVWSGIVRAFAMYDRELSPDEVTQHYLGWTHHEEKALANSKGAIAVYPFSEESGTLVHNEVDPAASLVIPDRFFVPNKPFLETPWDEFHPSWGYWKNAIVNVVGFVPFGFFFCALSFSGWDVRPSLIATILLGFSVSLTIEVLQGFLPTRSSGMTDLLTNTSGTALGATAYTTPIVRNWLGRLAKLVCLPKELGSRLM